jgi:hypothetical protein
MTVEVKKDGMADLQKAVAALTKTVVLIGVPDANAEREPEEGETQTASNATIGYIMETGDPSKNIPARPFLVPGIESVEKELTADLKKGGEAALSGKLDAVKRSQMSAGLRAQNAVQKKITDGPFAPLSEATIKARARRGRKGAQQYLKLKGEGVPEDVLQSASLVKPLIDTGQLRRAITFVIRDKGK